MVVCTYFLQGRCKYGDRCYNEHPRGGGGGGGGYGGGPRVTFRDSFGTGGNTQTQNPYRWSAGSSQQQQGAAAGSASAVSADDAVRSFPKEIEIWQLSNMWPFSCISIEKDIPSLPDFHDISPEELRYDAYTAIQQGNIETYKMKVSELIQQYRTKQDQLKSLSPALRQKLVELVEEGRRKKASGGGGPMLKPSHFGGQSSGGGTFGASAGSSSIFGSSASTSSTSTFGNTGLFQGSTFGGAPAGTQPTPGFSQSTSGSSSIFGSVSGAAAGSTGFGQQTTGAGLFGKGAAAPAGGGGLFGQSASTGGIFGQASGAVSGGGFGQSQGGGGFGQNSSAGSIFGQTTSASPGTSVFGQPTPSTSGSAVPTPGMFTPSSAPPPAYQSGVFGGSGTSGVGQAPLGQSSTFGRPFQSGGAGVGGTAGSAPSQPAGGMGFGSGGAAASSQQPQQSAGSSVYTPLDQLTADEKAQFQASTFTLGMIPMRPPPKELLNI